MSDPITIRAGTPADTELLAAYNELLATESEDLTLDPVKIRAGVRAVLEDASKGLYFIAERNGEPVGALMTTFEWSDWRNGTFLWVQSVFVAPEARRTGVFKTLYEHVCAKAREPGYCGVRLYVHDHNERAVETYRKLGMKKLRLHAARDGRRAAISAPRPPRSVDQKCSADGPDEIARAVRPKRREKRDVPLRWDVAAKRFDQPNPLARCGDSPGYRGKHRNGRADCKQRENRTQELPCGLLDAGSYSRGCRERASEPCPHPPTRDHPPTEREERRILGGENRRVTDREVLETDSHGKLIMYHAVDDGRHDAHADDREPV